MNRSEKGAHVRVNGIRQHYLHFPGPGPQVLIVPGIVSPAMLWSHVGAWLSQRYDCYILDVRGRGLSEAGPHLDYGADACAADLIAFVQALDLQQVIVVGHSMGGRIAVRAAARAPQSLGAVVMVDPPMSGPQRRAYPVPKSRTIDLLLAAHRGQAMQAIQNSPARPWPEDLQNLRAQWLSTCDERAVHVTYDDFHQQDVFADIAQVARPLSLLCAGTGGVVSDEDITEIHGLQKDLFVTRLAATGHQMQAEDFEAFKPALDEHLARHVHTLKEGRN